VHLEASTKPPIHDLIHEFLINMVFTMACPNFKKGLKMTFAPLGVNLFLFKNVPVMLEDEVMLVVERHQLTARLPHIFCF
jgi:hypothetical protein